MAPGATHSIDIAFVVSGRPSPGPIVNDATTAGVLDRFGTSVPPVADSASIAVTDPSITATKQRIGSGSVTIGDSVSFVLRATNSGNTTMTTTTIRDSWNPTFLTYDTATPAPAALGSSSATWTVGSLAPGASAEVTVTFTAGPNAGSTVNAVSVEGTDDHGDSVDATDSAPVTVVTPLIPAISVEKRLASGQDEYVQIGDNVDYDIIVTNSGDTTIAAGTILDTWNPAELDFVSAVPAPLSTTLASAIYTLPVPMAPGDILSIAAMYEVVGTPITGVAVNSVVSTGTVDASGTIVPGDSSSADVTVTAPGATLSKSLAPWQVDTVAEGDSVAFRLVLANSGDTVIPVASLVDTYDAAALQFVSAGIAPDSVVPGTLTWDDLGSLDPGDSVTIDATFTALAKPVSGITTNTLSGGPMVDEHGDTIPTSPSSADVRIIAPGLEITKSLAEGQQASVYIGETVSYDIVLTNTGDTTLTVVPLRDTYPTQLTFTSATPAEDRDTGTAVEWDDVTIPLGDLAPGAATTVSADFMAVASGNNIVNTATSSGAQDAGGRVVPDVSGADSVVTVLGPPQADLVKDAVPAPETVVMPGDLITYRLSFENTTSVMIPNAVLRDQMPAEVEYVAGTIVLDMGVPVDLTDAVDGDAGHLDSGAGSIVVDVGDLAPGARGTVYFTVRVRASEISRPGVFNDFTLQSGTETPQTSNTVRHPVDPFDITKSARDINGGRLESGDVIEWTIIVTNTGLIPTTEVVVTDAVPSEVTYVPGSITGPGADDSDPRFLVWNVGVLPVGGQVTLTFRSTVNSGLPAGTEIRNVAVVDSAETEPKASDDPGTPAMGDPTMLQTGGNDWIWLLAAVALLLAGLALLARWRGYTLRGLATRAFSRDSRGTARSEAGTASR